MLPGAAAPRGTLAPLASLVRERFRVITVDLPGQGTLAAVPYSLARCEMVLTLVVRRAQLSCPRKRVILAAQGASAYVACHFALRPASERLTAGLIVMGRVPDYVGTARCQCSFDSLYVMQWAAVFANRALKARIAASDWPPMERRVAGQSDFNMAAIPEIRNELHGLSLIYPLRDFKRTVIFLGPRAWVEEAEELVPVRHAQARRVRGARDDTLPPVDGLSIETMAAEVTEVRRTEALRLLKFRCGSRNTITATTGVVSFCGSRGRSMQAKCQQRTGRWMTTAGTTFPSLCPGPPWGSHLHCQATCPWRLAQ